MNSIYVPTTLFFVFFNIFVCSAQPCSRVSALPTFCITTEGPVASQDIYVNGSLNILADVGTQGLYNGGIRIRGRGNSTWGFEKKPYRINLNTSSSLLGLPATAKNWVLLANHADKTLIRNALAFDISTYLGLPVTASYRFVDVVLNGDYIGSYLLTDHIDVREHRVDIEEGIDESVTGAFLVEMDGFAYSEPFYITTNRGNTATIKFPDVDSHTSPHTNYVLNYLNEFESRLYSTLPSDGPGGYLEMVDLTSLVDWYLACELTGNSDAFWTIYLHKRRSDNRFFFGPLWDFDIAFDNDNRIESAPYRLMADVGHYYSYQDWILRFRRDDVFMSAVKQRWIELMEGGLRDYVLGRINTLSEELITSTSAAQNYTKWPVLNTRIYNEVFLAGTYDQHVTYLYDYMSERINWLDKEILGLPSHYYYRIDNLQSGKTVTAVGGGIVQKTFQNTAAFKWVIEPLNNGFYRIRHAEQDQLLSESVGGGQQLVLAPDDPIDRRQQWRITEVGSDVYALIGRDRLFGAENRNGASGEDNPIDRLNFTDNGHFQTWLGNTTAGRWTIGSLEPALPISVSNFTGHFTTEKTVQLQWSVTEFVNASHFEVERLGKDGVAHTLAIVSPGGGTGEYIWQDDRPEAGINYYRLKLVDLDKSFSFTNIISVESGHFQQPLAVYPNPVTDRLHFDMNFTEEGVVKIEIWNLAGLPVIESYEAVRAGLNYLKVDAGYLPEGMYILKTEQSSQTTLSRFIRSNR